MIYELAFTEFPEEKDSADFKQRVCSMLNICSKKYKMHAYPEMPSLSQTISAREQDQLQLNWKKWSSYKYIAAKFDDITAKTDLFNALTEKTELHTAVRFFDHSKVRTEMLSFYEAQIMFARDLMLEKRYTFMGEILPTRNHFLFEPSNC